MNKDYIPYEQAFELKGLGYDDECTMYYSPGGHPAGFYLVDATPLTNSHWLFTADDKEDRKVMCTAPLYQQAFRWFREKYSINSWIINAEDNNNAFKPFFRGNNIDEHLVDFYNTYEEAELARLKKLIEIVKNK
jgi:hypothetical protein